MFPNTKIQGFFSFFSKFPFQEDIFASVKRMVALMLVLVSGLVSGGIAARSEGRDSLVVMFWNLENFFDWQKSDSLDTRSSDAEFSYSGLRHWTHRRFQLKCNAIVKSILWVGDRTGRLPDVIGVAEVENRKVLELLLKTTVLRKMTYSIVHYDSPDPRGIDVALFYDRSRLELLESRPVRVGGSNPYGEPFSTRDILLVRLRHGEDSTAFIVNHHPSKYGGKGTDTRRMVAMQALSDLTDSLERAGCANIVAMGDFNDTPDGEAFQVIDGRLENLAKPLAAKGKGSIRFNGNWQLIDMFLVSEPLRESRMEILEIPFLTARDNKHSGEKPLRTYSGPGYLGGVSDHCPVLLEIH